MPPNAKEDIELAERLTRIEAAIEALRADLARYFAEHADHEGRLRVLERGQVTSIAQVDNLATRVNSLTARINAWAGANSVGAIVAAVIGWFR